MATGSNIGMLPTLDNSLQGSKGNLEDSLQKELELMLQARRSQQQILGREKDLNMFRSGSAPPTVEGSLTAVGSLFGNPDFSDLNCVIGGSGSSKNDFMTEEEIRSHPAYLSYYYSHENMNPRLPPPLLSKEDWRVAQRFQAGGASLGGGDWRKKKLVDDGGNSSLFSMQPGVSVQQAEHDLMELRNASRRNLSRNMSSEWLDGGSDGSVGISGPGLGARRKSFADIVQEGLDRPATLSGHLSRPASRNAFGDVVDASNISDSKSPGPPGFCNGVETIEGLHAGSVPPGFSGASLSRSTTPELQLLGRSTSSGLPPVGSRVGPLEKKNIVGSSIQNGHSSSVGNVAELAATLSGLSLSKTRHLEGGNIHVQCHRPLDVDNPSDITFNVSNVSNVDDLSFSNNYIDLARKNGIAASVSAPKINAQGQISIPKRTSSSASLYSKTHLSGYSEESSVGHSGLTFPNADLTGHIPGAHSVDQKLNSGSHLNAGRDGQILSRLGNQGSDLHSPMMDLHCSQYSQRNQYGTHRTASPADSLLFRNYTGTSLGDLDGLQKAYVEALLAQQNQQYELAFLGRSGGLNHGYYGHPSYGLGMPYAANSMASSVLPSADSVNFQNERISRFTSMMRSSMEGSMGAWNSDIGNNVEGRYLSSLLDEFKNNKSRSFELVDIIGHVVEFSTDQYGSRFIQQKLETAAVEEKNKIFPEIIPHARTLMTDVFGNYVIQKFFEHGTASQRAELASQLSGHVLPLSLQMYGCRVIQKALEVVDVDQQSQMVAELDGSVMKCVRDQNGNHVIQKCIECVPQDQIQFIISAFYGQVVALSTHPYGCRVIQRVLEHCDDANTQQFIMDEIMQSVCTLAQDQYGNYVIQHVLEHGRPYERSAIISKLAGQIVKMSQQKFASNVVEKCLTFGAPEERQILVKEMLGSTDENEPLQAMMKDPFGNYVVQKVLETCDDRSLELILSRIKVHLNTLKRYTYGKHIVSRVEKLITTGERRIGLLSSFAS